MENEKPKFSRADSRSADALRTLRFKPGVAPNATGSVLACFGDTKVICACTAEKRVPPWMGSSPSKGWISAEYAMLPYSTLSRKQRASSAGKVDGRSVEIQRLIGRSMRAVADLEKMPGITLWIDCDVLQADGGTRTASISGAYVAAKIAVGKLLRAGEIPADPFVDSVAAVSVGILEGTRVLDLPYVEDKDADVDANVVMTGKGRFVEIQATGEEASFSDEDLKELLSLAKKGISEIALLQEAAIASAEEECVSGAAEGGGLL